jgi:hypothetical protein
MQQQISPKIVAAVVAIVVLIVAVFAYRVYTGPSARPAGPGRGKAVAPNAGGGPTEADLQRMRQYNATHPGASSSYR